MFGLWVPLFEPSSQLQNHLFLTQVQESKGLEFDDVLLYNFFSDSTAGGKRLGYAVIYLSVLTNVLVSYSFRFVAGSDKLHERSH